MYVLIATILCTKNKKGSCNNDFKDAISFVFWIIFLLKLKTGRTITCVITIKLKKKKIKLPSNY